MSGQLSLTYRPSHAGSEAWQRQLELLRAAVEHLGRKEVSFEIDVSGSMLSDALNERDRKRWAAEWTHVVKAMLSARHDEVSFDLMRKLTEADAATTPFVVEQPAVMTADELAAAYERELRSMGDAGKAAIARATRKERRR